MPPKRSNKKKVFKNPLKKGVRSREFETTSKSTSKNKIIINIGTGKKVARSREPTPFNQNNTVYGASQKMNLAMLALAQQSQPRFIQTPTQLIRETIQERMDTTSIDAITRRIQALEGGAVLTPIPAPAPAPPPPPPTPAPPPPTPTPTPPPPPTPTPPPPKSVPPKSAPSPPIFVVTPDIMQEGRTLLKKTTPNKKAIIEKSPLLTELLENTKLIGGDDDEAGPSYSRITPLKTPETGKPKKTVINPFTQRDIVVGGPTYQRLLREGRIKK